MGICVMGRAAAAGTYSEPIDTGLAKPLIPLHMHAGSSFYFMIYHRFCATESTADPECVTVAYEYDVLHIYNHCVL